MIFSKRLKELREENDYTRTYVADKCDVSVQCISSLEAGTRSPTGSTLVALANFFDCSIDYLMGREGADDSIGFAPPVAETTTKEEREMLAIFRKLDHEMQHRAIGYLRRLADALVAERALAPKKA